MSATNVRWPEGIGTADNNFEVRKFTGGASGAETTHKTDPLPDAHWTGKYVMMLATGGNCHVAFSKNASAEVDRAVAATDAGVTDKVGFPLLNGIAVHCRLPYFDAASPLYFARESDAVGTVVYIGLSDEPGSKRNP